MRQSVGNFFSFSPVYWKHKFHDKTIRSIFLMCFLDKRFNNGIRSVDSRWEKCERDRERGWKNVFLMICRCGGDDDDSVTFLSFLVSFQVWLANFDLFFFHFKPFFSLSLSLCAYDSLGIYSVEWLEYFKYHDTNKIQHKTQAFAHNLLF